MKNNSHSERALRALRITLCLGFACVLLYSFQSREDFFSIAFSALLLSGASLFIGGILGFLFGIPKTLQPERDDTKNTDGSNEAQTNTDYRPNTNLEQVSDWLTKMLLGVGLTQLVLIPDHLRRIGRSIAPALGQSDAAPVMAVAVLIFFASVGFLIGFLWTRLHLATALLQADLDRLENQIEQAGTKIDQFERQAQRDANALLLTASQLAPDANAENVSQDRLNEAIASASSSVRTQVFTQAWQTRRKNWRSEKTKALMERAIPVFDALVKSDVEKKYHHNFGQLGYAYKDKLTPDYEKAIENLSEAIRIRGSARNNGFGLYDFCRAICYINIDPNFLEGKPSSEEDRGKVLRDLRSAASAGMQSVFKRDRELTRWLELNQIGPEFG